MALYERVVNVKLQTAIVPALTVCNGKLPTVEAPLGLHYYVPMVQPVSRVEIQGMIQSMFEDGIRGFGGARSNAAIPRSWKLWYINQWDRDVLYDLGYNPFLIVPGIGPALWGNRIAKSDLALPEAVTVFELLYAISQVAQCMEGEVDTDETFCTFQAIINNLMREMTARRSLYDPDGGPTIFRTDDGIDVAFQPNYVGHPMVLHLRRREPTMWTCSPNLEHAVDALEVLYPHLFYSEYVGFIKCLIFNNSVRIIYERDQSGDKASVHETSRISP
jgi:hypothetical protein